MLDITSSSATLLDLINSELVSFCEASPGTVHQPLMEALYLTVSRLNGESGSFFSGDVCMDLSISLFGISELSLNAWELENITLEDLSGLQFLDIETLELAGHQIESLEELKHMSSLRHLDLSWNLISDITGINELSGLQTIDLSWNNLSNLDGLQNHPSLESLNITGNPIDSLSGIREINSLTELSAAFLNYESDDTERGSFQDLDSLGTSSKPQPTECPRQFHCFR